jgi:hypothetical protein
MNSEIKNRFFDKITKIDNPLVKLTKRKRKTMKINEIRDGK